MRSSAATIANARLDNTTSIKAYGISTPKLKEVITSYFGAVNHYSLECAMLEAACVADKAMLDEFHSKLTQAKSTYQGAITHALQETYDDIKDVSSLLETPGLVLTLFERAANDILKAFHAFEEFAEFLEDNEERARHVKLERLHQKQLALLKQGETFRERYTKEQALVNDLYRIGVIEKKEYAAAIKLLSDSHIEAQEIADKSMAKVKENIALINQLMNFDELDIQEKLTKRMIGAFLLNGERSANTYGYINPYALFKVKLFHALRKRKLRLLTTIDSLVTHGFEATSKLDTFHVKCISALLKRFPTEDYSPSQLDYWRLIKQLVNIIELIKEPNKSFEQKLEQLSPLALCAADKRAYGAVLFRSYRYSRGLFNSSPNGNNRHLDIKDRLLSLFSRYQKSVDHRSKEVYKKQIKHIVSNIISFYHHELYQYFRNAELLQTELSKNSSSYTKQIKELALTLIKKELQDESPSPYHRAPLCGLAMFFNSVAGKLHIDMHHDERMILSLNLSYEDDIEAPALMAGGVMI